MEKRSRKSGIANTVNMFAGFVQPVKSTAHFDYITAIKVFQ